MSNQLVLAAVQTLQSELLTVVSVGLAADLAVSPVIVAGEPGIGKLNMLHGIAKGLDMEVADIRCTMLQGMDFLPILKNGEIVDSLPRIEMLDATLAKGRATMVILDDPAPEGYEMGHYAKRIIDHVTEVATAPVLLVISCAIPDVEPALALLSGSTGIHRAHIPTAILRMDRETTLGLIMQRGIPRDAAEGMLPQKDDKRAQPILLLGSLDHTGSKCGLRFFEVTVAKPYEHRVHVQVVAKPDQDDDAMFERGDVALRVTPNEYGDLECTTDDMEFVG
jgi:hypothetical protein